MKNLLFLAIGTCLLFFSAVIEGWALSLETTVTATISAVEGDSSLQSGDKVTFQWIYDLSSKEMHSYCDHGGGVCKTFDQTDYPGFHFLSDATLKFSSHFDQILTKSLSLGRHQYHHKTVVYGGIVGDDSVFRFIHKSGDCYLSIDNYGEEVSMYLAVFNNGKGAVKGVGYRFRDVKFKTTTAKGTPDPQLATKLLSNTGILMLAKRH